MTKRRPSNKKPTGMNKSLGNSLCNEREKNRKKHKIMATEDDLDNPAFIEEEIERALESKTFESNMEELFAKATLAGSSFSAERGALQIVDKDSTVVVRTAADVKDFNELRSTHSHLLKIPRRPDRRDITSPEELHEAENEMFLKWRAGLSQLEEMDGVVLTPFERNLDIWRELWRVVERSDIVVQIVDARNPLLFRSEDLEDYVRSVDPAKKNVLLVNKADLLLPQQQRIWAQYFKENDIDVIFWSALEPLEKQDEMKEEEDEESDASGSEDDKEEGDEKREDDAPAETRTEEDKVFVSNRDELLRVLRERGGRVERGGRPLVIGFVGYPNVGKSSTINKLVSAKKVNVSATPGKTKRLQTIVVDKELTLCDCPGLVMPSFAFDRDEMFLNGIMPVEQMRDHFGPTRLLISRVPPAWIADRYSLTLPDPDSIDALKLLTAIAFMRGLMSSKGVPDCSRAARVLIREVATGSILWVASPPSVPQPEFDKLLFPPLEEGAARPKGQVQLRAMERRGLLETSETAGRRFDSAFFAAPGSQAHIRFSHPGVREGEGELGSTKKHFKKKEKLRRVFVGMYA